MRAVLAGPSRPVPARPLHADIVALRSDDADTVLERIGRVLVDRTRQRVGAAPARRGLGPPEAWLETDWSDIYVDVTDGPASVPHCVRRATAGAPHLPDDLGFSVWKSGEYTLEDGRVIYVYAVQEGWTR